MIGGRSVPRLFLIVVSTEREHATIRNNYKVKHPHATQSCCRASSSVPCKSDMAADTKVFELVKLLQEAICGGAGTSCGVAGTACGGAGTACPLMCFKKSS